MTIDPGLDLVLERILDLPPEVVWAAWTTPEHICQWFTPAPWKTLECELDLRPGGLFRTLMQGPDGQQFPNVGCILEVVPHRRLVWTDALIPGFRPSGKPFFTAMILLEPHGAGTHYTAVGLHRDEAGRKQHDEMGFHAGWGTALDQLVAHMKSQ